MFSGVNKVKFSAFICAILTLVLEVKADFENDIDRALGVGIAVFVAIVVALLVVVIGVPIAICYCCGACCFAKRKSRPTQQPIHQVYNDGKPTDHGNLQVSLAHQNQQHVQQIHHQQHIPHHQQYVPALQQTPVGFDKVNTGPQSIEIQTQTYGTRPVIESHTQTYGTRPVVESHSQTYGNLSSPGVSPVHQAAPFSPSAPQAGAYDPAFPGDPNYIPNRFSRPQSGKPRTDPTWNAVTAEMKDWQKEHNIYYGNTYKPGAYGAPMPPRQEQPAETLPQRNAGNQNGDGFMMY